MVSMGSVVELNEQNLQDVLQSSVHKPLLLVFWAPYSEVSKVSLDVFTRVVTRYQERVLLAKLNTDDHPMIAQQLGAMQVPLVKLVVQGQIVANLTGQEPEADIQALLERLVGPMGEEEAEAEAEELQADDQSQFLQSIEQAVDAGQVDQAVAALESALQEDAEQKAYRLKLIQLYIQQGRQDQAEEALQVFPEKSSERKQAQAYLAFFEASKVLEPLNILQERLVNDDQDLMTRYGLGVYASLDFDFDQAKEHFWLIFSKDRNFKEDLGKTVLLQLLDLMGPQHDLVKGLRRKLFTYLH